MIHDLFVAPGDPERAQYVLDVVRQRMPLDGLRVLDLGCRTGNFARAFAEAGAVSLGVEGQAVNFDRIPPTDGARYVLGDVRDLEKIVDGERFDVALCLGVLYHLDAVDAVGLLRAMRRVTDGFAVVDTHGARSPVESVTVDGAVLHGSWYGEPPEGSPWSSIGNLRSFWFTPESLADAARLAGWTQVESLPGARYEREPAGRLWRILS